MFRRCRLNHSIFVHWYLLIGCHHAIPVKLIWILDSTVLMQEDNIFTLTCLTDVLKKVWPQCSINNLINNQSQCSFSHKNVAAVGLNNDFRGCTKPIQCKIILMEQLAFVFLNIYIQFCWILHIRFSKGPKSIHFSYFFLVNRWLNNWRIVIFRQAGHWNHQHIACTSSLIKRAACIWPIMSLEITAQLIFSLSAWGKQLRLWSQGLVTSTVGLWNSNYAFV